MCAVPPTDVGSTMKLKTDGSSPAKSRRQRCFSPVLEIPQRVRLFPWYPSDGEKSDRVRRGILKKYKGQLQIGSLEGKAPPPPPKKEEPKVEASPTRSGPAAPVPAEKELKESLEPYGDLVPFGDPAWYQGVSDVMYRGKKEANFALRSITRPTITSRTRRCGMRSGSGSRRSVSRSSTIGRRTSLCRQRFTRRWGLLVTCLGMSI
jgi:hypothetical protein